MKKIVKNLLPFLLLILVLGFMIEFKTLDDLTDTERYDIKTFAQHQDHQMTDDELPVDGTAMASTEEEKDNSLYDDSEPADPNMVYAVATSEDEQVVTVYDDKGNAVFETSRDDWEAKRDYYYNKYRLGTSS